MKKIVWKVKGYCSNRDEDVFEAYFTDRDVAHEVYHKGEREYGYKAGYTNIHWALQKFYADDSQHVDQMFNDVKEAMEES